MYSEVDMKFLNSIPKWHQVLAFYYTNRNVSTELQKKELSTPWMTTAGEHVSNFKDLLYIIYVYEVTKNCSVV